VYDPSYDVSQLVPIAEPPNPIQTFGAQSDDVAALFAAVVWILGTKYILSPFDIVLTANDGLDPSRAQT
jgi:hypothetical protein